MAELTRYRGGGVRPTGGGEDIYKAQSQFLGGLADRIESFKGVAMREYAEATEVEAKKDAEQAFTQRGLGAKVNEDMTVYGQTYTNALTNMHKKRLAIDTGVTVKGLYEANKDNPLIFEEATKEVYNKTSELLPEHLKAEYAIDFEANKAHYAGQVKSNRIKLDKQKDVALTNELFQQATEGATRAARDGNHDLSTYELNKGIASLDSALENGTITAEQHRKGIDGIKFETSTSVFKGVNDSHINDGDLQGSQDFIESFRTSAPEGFSDKQRERLADDMQGDLNRQIKQNNAIATAGKAEASIAVKDATKIYKSGKKPENYGAVQEAYNLATPSQQHEFNVAEEAYNVILKVEDKTLPEQQSIINALEADPNASRVEIEALAQAKKNLSDKMTMATKDPYSLGVNDGLYTQEGIISPNQGLDSLAFLEARAKQSKISASAYGVAPKLFTDSEAQQWSTWLESSATSINDKLDFIDNVEASTPSESNLVYDQLMKKGSSVFAFAGSMVKKGDRQKAEKMLRGQMILREQPNVVPMDIMQWKFNGEVGNAMRYQGAGARKALTDSTTAYYAALAEEQGELSKADAPISLVKQAVQEVTGGVGIKNDQNYFLPPGVTDSDDVDDWIEELTAKDFENVGGITSQEAVDLVNRGQLISVGEGTYQVVFQGKRLTTKDGTPFIMEYGK